MRIRILSNQISYLPEAEAYASFLSSRGWDVAKVFHKGDFPNPDIEIQFMGVDPIWEKTPKYPPIIHEYNSLSTGRFPKCKNSLKTRINKKPNARIFLNQFVQNEFCFRDSTPSILRDMGVDKGIFQKPGKDPEFDLVYCGSLGRTGVKRIVDRLSSYGLKILLVGEAPKDVLKEFHNNKKVALSGRVSRSELPSIYRQAKAGLNITPNIYPYNVQTSTKTLEYCAAGLGVVSNRYIWVENFASKRQANFLWLDDIKCSSDLHNFCFGIPNVEDLEWTKILARIGFTDFLETIAK